MQAFDEDMIRRTLRLKHSSAILRLVEKAETLKREVEAEREALKATRMADKRRVRKR